MAKSNDILKRYGIYSSTQKDEEEEKENSKADSVLEKYGLDSRPASGQDKSAGNDILKKYGLTPIRGTGVRNPTPEQSARNALIDYGIKTDSMNRYISQNPYDPNDNTMRYYQNQAKRVPTEIDDYIKTLSAAGIGEDHPYYQSLDSFKQYYADLEKGFENAYKQTPEYAMLNYDSEAGQKEIDRLKQKEAERNKLRSQLNFLQSGGGAAGSYAAASGMYTDDERKAEIERLQSELAPYANVDTELEQAQSMKYYSENLQKYNEVQNRDDFSENSQYKPTGENGWWNQAFNFSDYATKTYELINNMDDAKSSLGNGFYSLDQVSGYHYDLMEPEERKMFNYLFNTQGKEAASEYLDYIQPELNRRNMQNIADQEKAYAQQNFGTGLLASIGSVPNSLFGGLGALDVTLQKIQRDITGEYKPIDYNTNAMIPSIKAASARQAVGESITNATGVIQISEEEHPILAKVFNGKSLADVYNLGMSIADSAAAALLTKGLGKIGVPQKLASGLGSSLLGGNAASQGMIEAIANGATDEQALQLGLMNGLYESLFEAVSIDNLTKDTAAGFFKTMLKQGGIEASEEAMTTIANTFADIAIMAENSDYEKNISAYMEQGMTREEAEKQAFLDSVIQVGWDAFGGFLSGGVSAGGKYAIGSAVQNIKTYEQNKAFYGDYTGSIISDAMELSPENKFVQSMQQKQGKGKELSGREITRLMSENQKATYNADAGEVRAAAIDSLNDLGETGNVEAIADAITKQVTGEKLTRRDKSVISESQFGSRVASEISAYEFNPTNYYADIIERIADGSVKPDNFQKAEITQKDAPSVSTASENSAQFTMVDPDTVADASEPVPGSIQNLEQSDENPVSIDEVAQKYGAQSSYVKKIYNIGSNQDVKQFDSAFERVFNYAQSGTVRLDVVKNLESIRSVLTDKQIELAYETGTAAANTAARNLEANNLEQANGKNGRKTGVVKGEGISIEDLKKTFNDTQNIAYKLLSTYAEATGIDIVLYQSEMDASGNFQGAQGRFKRGEPGTIFIDINAGLNGKHDVGNLAKYTMLRTFAHEFTHFIEKWNPVQYNEFRKVVFDTLRERGENVDDLVEAKQATGLSYDMASREVVAEAMTDILPDTHFVQNLAEKHKSIFQKLMEKLKEFVEGLRSYFNSLGKNRSREANALKQQVGETVRYVENIVKMFDQVAEQAVENYQLTVAVDEVTGGITIEEKPVAEVAEENVTETEDPVVPSTQELESSAAPVAPTENTEVKAAARRSSGSKKKTSLTSLLQFVKKASDERLRGAYTAQDGKQYLTDGSFAAVFNSADSTLDHKADFPIDVVTSFLSAAHKQQNTENYRIDDSEIRTLNRTATKKNMVLVKVGPSFFNVKYVYALSRAFENPVYSLYRKNNLSSDISILRVSADNGEAILMPVRAPGNTQAAYEAKLSTPNESEPSENLDISPVSQKEDAIDETTAVAQKAPETSTADELVDTKVSEEYTEPQISNIEKKSATKKTTASHTVETSVKLEDFGEKIGGAKFSDVISESFDLEQEQRRDYQKYSYEWFVSKPDMPMTVVDMNFPDNQKAVVQKAKDNAATIGRVNPKDRSVSVYVDDIGTNIVLGTKGLRHGLDRRFSLLAPITVKAGEIIKNSILINEITPRDNGAMEGYVLIGIAKASNGQIYIVRSVVNRFANELASMDVLYAINAKKEPAGRLSPQGGQHKSSNPSGSKISIASLLSIVNQHFPDVLPEDVLKHYGHDRRPDGTFSEDVLYQQRTSPLTDRDVLEAAANDIGISDMSDAEQAALQTFKDRLTELHELQEKRAEAGRLYKEQRFGANVDRQAAAQTLERMYALDKQIAAASRKVLGAENSEVLKPILQYVRKSVEKKERERSKAVLERWRDRRDNAEAIKKYRSRIQKDVSEISGWATNPDGKNAVKHIPEVIRSSVIPFLTSIDFSSKSLLSGKSPTQADVKFAEKLSKLKYTMSEVVAEDLYSGYADLPPDFIERLYILSASIADQVKTDGEKFVINQMDSQQLKALSEIVRNLKVYIKNFNKFHNNAMFRHAYEAGDNTIKYLQGFKRETKAGSVSNFLKWQVIRPIFGFDRFGDGGVSIFREFMEADDKFFKNTKKLFDFVKTAYSEKEAKEWTSTIKTFELESGKKLSMPVTFAMSFYCLYSQGDSRRHIEKDGIRVATFQNGEKKVSDDGSILTQKDILTILNSLTKEQKEIAQKIQKFMATVGAEWGNYVSVARFGEKLFGNPDYFPINSDGRNFEATADEHPGSAALYALLNASFTKQRNDKASNRIIVYDILDVFANHMASMAQYNAYALPILDALKWLNYEEKTTVKEEKDGKTKERLVTVDSVRSQLAKAFGSPVETNGKGKQGYAESFIVNLIKSLNGAAPQGTQFDSLGKKFLSNYNRSMIAYNGRVVVQQPISIVRAAEVISYGSILNAMRSPAQAFKANKEMMENSGVAFWKSAGFFDVNISSNLVSMMKYESSIVDKISDVGMYAASKADEITWQTLWLACKYEVAKSGIKPSNSKFMDEVNHEFQEVIYRTQVVDSVLVKGEFIRDKGFFAKATSSFMSEPTTNYSLLVSAYDKMQMSIRNGESFSEAFKKHGKSIIRTVGIYSIGAILLAVTTGIYDSLRDDDDYQTFMEKFQAAFGGNLVEELLPFNKIPIVADFYDLAKELLSRAGALDTYGNPPNTVYMQWFETLADSVEILHDRISGEKTNYQWFGGIYKLLQATSGITGLPIAPFVREVSMIWNNTAGRINPDRKLKTYEMSKEAEIKYAYMDGILTFDEAVSELLSSGRAEDSDDAYWTVTRWSHDMGNPDDDFSRFGDYFNAAKFGDDTTEFVDELLQHGYDKYQIESGIKNQTKNSYQNKEISKSEAISILEKNTEMDDEEITKVINQWSCKIVTGIDYNEIEDEYVEGNITFDRAVEMYTLYGGYKKDDAKQIVMKYKCEVDTGIKYNKIEDEYVSGNLTFEAAKKLYISYGGYDADDATSLMMKYKCKVDTGIDYNDIKSKFMSGSISHDRAVDLYTKYGGYDEDDAEDLVTKWGSQKDTGIKYDEISEEFMNGRITRQKAKDMYIKYGGYEEDEAEEKVVVLEFVKENPSCEGISYSAVSDYKEYCEKAGVSETVFFKAWKFKNSVSSEYDDDGEVTVSKREKVLDYINSLPINRKKKDSLYYAFGYSEKTIYDTPWH